MCLHDGRLDGVAAIQKQRVDDEKGRNVNNSSTSVTRRLYSHVDRLFEGSPEDRERALELLRAKEQQVICLRICVLMQSAEISFKYTNKIG